MKRIFADMVERNVPKANPLVMNGLVVNVIPRAFNFIDDVLKNVSKTFPEGLTYDGCERCTPEEEYMELIRCKSSKHIYDIGKNTTYLVKFRFSFNGERLDPDRYLYLPYLEDGGILYAYNALLHASPVLVDKVFSVDGSRIFVRLLKIKFFVDRGPHNIVIDGQQIPSSFTYIDVYKQKDKSAKPKGKNKYDCKTSITHYLLGKYGFYNMFKKFGGVTKIAVGTKTEINTVTYPINKWVICESTRLPPKNVNSVTNLKIAISRDQWSDVVKNLVTEVFYIIDHYSDDVNIDNIDDVSTWKVIMGKIIFGSNTHTRSRLLELINKHYDPCDYYLDTITKKQLESTNIKANDFYELMFSIMNNFTNYINKDVLEGNSLYDKYFEVLIFMLYNITTNLVELSYSLTKLANKKPLTPKIIRDQLNIWFKTNAVLSITRNVYKVVNGVNYAGDNKYPKITAICQLQQATDKGPTGKKSRSAVNSSKQLHVSAIEVGSLLQLSKSQPIPQNRTNMFCQINEITGEIIPNQKYREILDRTQADMERRSESNGSIDNILIDEIDENIE